MIVLIGLIGAVIGMNCGMFKCKTSSIHFPDESYCIHTIADTYYIDPCSASPYACQVSYPYNETKCTYLSPYTASSRYPGESCKYNSDCYYSTTCISGVCVGQTPGLPCTTSRNCEIGSFCSTDNFCVKQLPTGEFGCNNDYQCENTAGCRLISNTNSALNQCVKYFSLSSLSPLINVNGMICKSGFTNGTHCMEAPVSKTVPNKCTSNLNCTSKAGGYQGYCLCGYNSKGSSYCTLFAGDEIALKANSYTQKWLESSHIAKAHTNNRFRYTYIKENWNREDAAKYEYYNTYYNNFALYYEAEECALEVFGFSFLQAKEAMKSDESSSDFSTVLAVGVLTYLL